MKSFTFLTILIFLSEFQISGQNIINIKELNAYRYVEIDPPARGNGNTGAINVETLRTTHFMEELFVEKGFLQVPRDSSGKTPTYGGKLPMPADIQKNKCLNLIWFWGFSASGQSNEIMKVMAVNCRDEIIFQNSYQVKNGKYDKALIALLTPILKANYQFDETLNHKIFIPKVDLTTETEETLREYFLSSSINPIEGIYKSLDTELKEDLAFYKIGIKFMNGRYRVIVLETDNTIWKLGEIKAYFEKAENTNLFSTTYYLSDKTKVEGFSELSDLILRISVKIKFQTFSNGAFKDNEKISEIKFIKVFPK